MAAVPLLLLLLVLLPGNSTCPGSTVGNSTQYTITVEPPMMDTVKSGQPPYNGHTVRPLLYNAHTFLPPKKGQPLNNGQNARPQRLHYSEVSL